MSETPYPNDPPTSRWSRHEVYPPSNRAARYEPPRRDIGEITYPKKIQKPNDDPADMETKRARHLDSMAQERRSQESSNLFNPKLRDRKIKEKLQEKIHRKITNNFIAESFMDGIKKFFLPTSGLPGSRLETGYDPWPDREIEGVTPGKSPRKNPGLAPIKGPTIGDIIQWGNVRKQGREIIAGRGAGSSDPGPTIGDIIQWGNVSRLHRGREIIAGRGAGSSDPQRRKAAHIPFKSHAARIPPGELLRL